MQPPDEPGSFERADEEKKMPRSDSAARSLWAVLAVAVALGVVWGVPALAGTPTETAPTTAPAVAPPAEQPAAPPAEQQPEAKPPNLWQIITLGGWMMYVLAALSFMMIALIAFHFMSLTPSNVMPAAFVVKVREMLEKRRFSEAQMYCSQHKSAISSVVQAGLENASKKQVFIIEAMNSEGSRQASRFWQQISYLADISVVAPMCGLLGTVTGMLWTFRELSYARGLGAGQINPVNLAGGIFQAMITTAAGLIIGIIATGFYSIFRGMVQRIIISLEETSDRFADLIARGE
jgi:biopolymer transport protein ExbB